jgi:hypothetical protein
MAAHTEIIGDLSMPIGMYEVTERGQVVKKKRHRQIGVVMRSIWDDGRESLSVRLHAEILSQPVMALLSRSGLLPVGEDSVLCPVYARDRKASAPTPKDEPEVPAGDEDAVPF